MKKLSIMLFLFTVLLSGTLISTAQENVAETTEGSPVKTNSLDGVFSDIQADAWYAESLSFSLDKGLLKGYSDGTFHPERAVKWWTVAQILSNFTEDVDFSFSGRSDFDGMWYASVMYQAEQFGLIPTRTDREFPEEAPTRYQVIQAFYQLGLKTGTVKEPSNRALDWALEEEVLIGDEKGELHLGDHITRAELCEVLHRLWGSFDGHRQMERIFFLNEENVEYISVLDGRNGKRTIYTDRETVRSVVGCLNDFRAGRISKWTPAGGYDCVITLYMTSPGQQLSLTAWPGGLRLGSVCYEAQDPIMIPDSWIDQLCQCQERD